eukprot:754757_1
MEDVTIEIDLSMFDALSVKFCYIKLEKNCSLTLSNSSQSNEIYFRNMLCIEAAQELRFTSKCTIKSAQIWLLDIDTITVDTQCKISSISLWIYRCKKIINHGILSQIVNCRITAGDGKDDSFIHNYGALLCEGYMHIKMKEIINTGRIESNILYHVDALTYDDSETSATFVGDCAYFNTHECFIKGTVYTGNAIIMHSKNSLTLSSRRIAIRNFCYLKATRLHMTNNKQMCLKSKCNDTCCINQTLHMFYAEASSFTISDSTIVDDTSDGVIILNHIDKQLSVTNLYLSSNHKLCVLNSNWVHFNRSLIECNELYAE